jgi:hypothetical protein
MTATALPPARFTFRDDAERETARIMLARLLVHQARMLRHDIDPKVAADAARPLPAELSIAG